MAPLQNSLSGPVCVVPIPPEYYQLIEPFCEVVEQGRQALLCRSRPGYKLRLRLGQVKKRPRSAGHVCWMHTSHSPHRWSAYTDEGQLLAMWETVPRFKVTFDISDHSTDHPSPFKARVPRVPRGPFDYARRVWWEDQVTPSVAYFRSPEGSVALKNLVEALKALNKP